MSQPPTAPFLPRISSAVNAARQILHVLEGPVLPRGRSLPFREARCPKAKDLSLSTPAAELAGVGVGEDDAEEGKKRSRELLGDGAGEGAVEVLKDSERSLSFLKAMNDFHASNTSSRS